MVSCSMLVHGGLESLVVERWVDDFRGAGGGWGGGRGKWKWKWPPDIGEICNVWAVGTKSVHGGIEGRRLEGDGRREEC